MHPYFEKTQQNIFTAYYQKSYDYGSHFHSNVEITYCFRGRQDAIVDDISYALHAGDAIVIFPNAVHEYKNPTCLESADTESISIICDLGFLVGIIPELKTMYPDDPFIKASLVSQDTATAFRRMVSSENDAELLGWSLVALSGLMGNLKLSPAKASDSGGLAPAMIKYIDENFQKPLSLKALGREFGYSTSYLAHVFCDRLKLPFSSYLSAVRCEHAAKLILNTNKSLSEISFESGYNSLNTFCRCFKKHFGKTPSQYKRAARKDAE